MRVASAGQELACGKTADIGVDEFAREGRKLVQVQITPSKVALGSSENGSNPGSKQRISPTPQ
jgi:hypothetical protein